MAKAKLKTVETPKLLKLDLGCGKNKKPGFEGVDSRPFEGVDHVVDLKGPWPWKDETVEEVNAAHVIEHFEPMERVHFVNELYRVLIPGGSCLMVAPHWASQRAYGDMTHKWPPVSEMWFYYLNRDWRTQNVPHNDFYTCHFDCTWGYSVRQDLTVRNQEYQQYAMTNFKEACQDIICTLKKPLVKAS